MKQQQIAQLSQIEHVLQKPSMYVGSIVKEPQEEFVLKDNSFSIEERSYIPALIKTFNEWIDNSIDEFVRTGGKFANRISVKMNHNSFECSDNGRGIPNIKMMTLNNESKYQAEVAFTEMLSGANYDNDSEATLGTNGIGSKAGSIFSKKSTIINDDSKKRITIITKNNLSDIEVKETESKGQGITAKIFPDLGYFGITEIDEIHIGIIQERLLHLSVSYPGITFRFNGKSMKINSKKYLEMFNTQEIFQLNDNVSVAVGVSESDTFEHFSLVNGLVTKVGGTHINNISQEIVTPIRDKLVKKFKTIKPNDIKNKLRMIVIFKEFMNARHTSQTKEEITNSTAELKAYLGDYNMDNYVKKILKNEDIMLPIVELFMLKEQAKQNAELKKKTKKKIKSEKYLPAIKHKKYLFLTEGESASGSLIPALGREENGFYMLKGMPLNAYDASLSKFNNNKELSELYQIIQNEEYDYIIAATDQDLPGYTIRGLLAGFIEMYLKDYKDKFGVLNTPVLLAKKGKKVQRWVYNLNDDLKLQKGEKAKFLKGLGSSNASELEEIIKIDGLNNMIKMFDFSQDGLKMLDDWLNSSKSDTRKEYLMSNSFDIARA